MSSSTERSEDLPNEGHYTESLMTGYGLTAEQAAFVLSEDIGQHEAHALIFADIISRLSERFHADVMWELLNRRNLAEIHPDLLAVSDENAPRIQRSLYNISSERRDEYETRAQSYAVGAFFGTFGKSLTDVRRTCAELGIDPVTLPKGTSVMLEQIWSAAGPAQASRIILELFPSVGEHERHRIAEEKAMLKAGDTVLLIEKYQPPDEV